MNGRVHCTYMYSVLKGLIPIFCLWWPYSSSNAEIKAKFRIQTSVQKCVRLVFMTEKFNIVLIICYLNYKQKYIEFFSKLFAKKLERLFDADHVNSDSPENASTLFR